MAWRTVTLPGPTKMREYLNSVYAIEWDGRRCEFVFGGARSAGAARMDVPRPWAIVSACNPMSRKLSAAENAERMRGLDAELRAMGVQSGFAEGRSRGGEWKEESRVLVGVGREVAVGLGQRYGQRAIVWAGEERSGAGVGILDCWTGRLVVRAVRVDAGA